MDYEIAYKEALNRAKLLKYNPKKVLIECENIPISDYIFPELKETEDELTWLKNYISEEAYCLSMDIRGNEDSVKLQKLQKALAWLEKQGKQSEQKLVEWNEEDEGILNSFLHKLEVCDLLSNKEIIWFKDKLKSLRH